VNGWPGNTTAMQMPMSNYTPLASQKDGLRSPKIDLTTNSGSAKLGFDLAYRVRGGSNLLMDSLNIYISDDCGANYTKVYSKWGEALKTVTQIGPDFEPVSRQDWKREYVDLSMFVNQEIVIQFESVNRKGNNLYLDNISVFEGQVDPLTLSEELLFTFKISPNPTVATLLIELEKIDLYTFKVYDLTGKIILNGTFNANLFELDLTNTPSGMYYISLFTGQENLTQKFIKL
jgi:hypothetical protein